MATAECVLLGNKWAQRTERGTPGADIHGVQAWALSTGSANFIAGAIDTGVDYNHRDLSYSSGEPIFPCRQERSTGAQGLLK